MVKTKIINCYFGKLPAMFETWLSTCKINDTFDFLLVTDQIIDCSAPNIEIVNMSFGQLKELIANKMPFQTMIDKPYKLCDFKVAYGIIFSEYLIGYDFWGYCDNDMLFGDLSHYFTQEVYNKYCKILYLGHLSLYKNVQDINNIVVKENSLIDWSYVYSSPKVCGVDEDKGIYQLYLKMGIPVYNERIFFDIDPKSSFVKLDNIINKRMGKVLDKNYKKQLLVWQNGKVFRYYSKNKTIYKDEGVYIHCGGKRIDEIEVEEDAQMFVISRNKIIGLNRSEVKESDFKKYNDFSALRAVYEKLKVLATKVANRLSLTRYDI